MSKQGESFCYYCEDPIFWKTTDGKPVAYDDRSRTEPHDCLTKRNGVIYGRYKTGYLDL